MLSRLKPCCWSLDDSESSKFHKDHKWPQRSYCRVVRSRIVWTCIESRWWVSRFRAALLGLLLTFGACTISCLSRKKSSRCTLSSKSYQFLLVWRFCGSIGCLMLRSWIHQLYWLSRERSRGSADIPPQSLWLSLPLVHRAWHPLGDAAFYFWIRERGARQLDGPSIIEFKVEIGSDIWNLEEDQSELERNLLITVSKIRSLFWRSWLFGQVSVCLSSRVKSSGTLSGPIK